MSGIERATETGQHLVDLGFRDDEGWRKGDPIAYHAQHEAMLMPDPIDDLAGSAGRRVTGARLLSWTSSTPAIIPTPATSPTSGCPANPAGHRSCGGRGAGRGR